MTKQTSLINVALNHSPQFLRRLTGVQWLVLCILTVWVIADIASTLYPAVRLQIHVDELEQHVEELRIQRDSWASRVAELQFQIRRSQGE